MNLKLLNSFSSEDFENNHTIPKEAEIGALHYTINRETVSSTCWGRVCINEEVHEDLQIKTAYRAVEDDLIKELYAVQLNLSQTKSYDARSGEGFCTDFRLFTRTRKY